ncbi:MAG: hypothetical protein JW870_10965 [Candidatus Delongbacteria bacterium]|nr:hypothetical protein [Candidatus Delongbacteria bacterium]
MQNKQDSERFATQRGVCIDSKYNEKVTQINHTTNNDKAYPFHTPPTHNPTPGVFSKGYQNYIRGYWLYDELGIKGKYSYLR